MTPREKVLRALNHEAGPVPIDFGGTPTTGMHCTCVEALRAHYGLEQHPVRIVEPYQMLGLVEDDLAAAIGIDTVGVCPPRTMFGDPLEPIDKPWRTPWGQEVLVSRACAFAEADGEVRAHPEGDRSAAPSGLMPDGGFFFDALIRQQPIDEDRLDPADNLEEFGPISDEDLAWFREQVARQAATGRAVVANFGGTALGDIALVPAPFLKAPRGIRDVAEWYMLTATDRGYVRAVFERQTELALANLAEIHAAVGDAVDVVFLCGTDFGTQSGQFCSPATFAELWQPFYEQLNGWIHAHTTWKTFKHSCGAVEPLMESFIAAGFDVVNPVQCSAAGMEAKGLKERYGDRLVFWGGGADTQQVLPFGTPEQVRAQVLERCEVFSSGGGFVFDAIHNLQARTPVANLVAMIDAVREFNG